MTDPIDPTGVLAELAKLVAADREMDLILDDVVELVRRRIPGADEVSVTLIRNEKASTVACTGSLAMDLDELQYEQGYGPCLDAGRTDEVKHIVDAATETRWPRYVPRARQQGLGSSVSVPMPVENYLVGAINIYSRTPHAYPPDSVALAVALATHGTAALSVAEAAQGHRDRALHLRRALESHAVIDQAKGMIMVQQKCPADVAFQMLRKLSMDQNIKLYELAASLVASGSNHPVLRSS